MSEMPPPTIEDLKRLHTFLTLLMPPDDFPSDSAGKLLSPSALHNGVPFFRYKGVRSLTRALGYWLGGVDDVTDARWEHAADPVRLRIVGEAVVKRHLRFCENRETMLKAARWCSPNGHHSLLVPGTSRWNLLRAVAQLFYRQQDETEATHLRRCWCWDAWVGHDEYAKPAIVVLLLLHIALGLASLETPLDLRLGLADGARSEELERLQEAPEAFCSLHPCEPFPLAILAIRVYSLPNPTSHAAAHSLPHAPHRCPLASARRGGRAPRVG